MYTKQIFSPNKNSIPSSPSQPKQQNIHGLFTSQAIKTSTNFFSQKALRKDEAGEISTMQTKFDPSILENPKFILSKLTNHTHNLSENPEIFHPQKNSNLAKKTNSDMYKKSCEYKDNVQENVKKIPTFEAKCKERIKESLSKHEEITTNTTVHAENQMQEKLLIKNQDTGEIFYIKSPDEVEKLQESLHHEYFEKLKKRKKEEIWQDWWQIKKKNNQELLLAAKNNNILHVKKLFEENQADTKPEINSKDEKDWTCLHYAALAGNYDLVLLLIKLDAAIDEQTNLKQTSLIISAQKGYANIVSLLLTSGSNVNHQDLCNNTALHYSSIYGFKDVVKILLANPSINVNLKNLENRTASEATSFSEIKKWIELAQTKNKLLEISLNKNTSLSNLKTGTSFDKESKHFSPEMKKRSSNKINEREKYDELIKPLFKINDRTLSNITLAANPLSNTASVSENDTTLFLLSDMILEKEKIGPHSFNLLSLIGKGSFGEVYLVEKKSSHEYFALKVLLKDKIISNNLVKYAITERNVLSFCSHPFIVKLHAAFQTMDRLFLVQTYCPGGDLSKYLSKEKRFPESKVQLYAAEVLLALEHLHKKDIIYRDLKPDNIVLDAEGHALLTDFGLSREGVYDQLVAKSFCGSIAYLAPEMLRRQGHGKAVDWYLLGVLVYEMLVGIPPYYSEHKQEIFQNIDKGSLKFPNYLSKEAKSLLQKLLEKDPNKRLGSGPTEAKEIKEHSFFQNINWDEIYERKKSPGTPYLMKNLDKYKKGVDLETAFTENDGKKTGIDEIPGWSFVQNEQK